MTETMDVQLDETASMAEADRILSEAGWSPVRVVVSSGGEVMPSTRGAFAFKNLVCGHPPEGSRMTYAGKELTKIPQAKAAVLGLDPADYPDTHHEAAAWLVEHAKPKNALSTAATLEPIAVEAAPETEETPPDETHAETGETRISETLSNEDQSPAPGAAVQSSDGYSAQETNANGAEEVGAEEVDGATGYVDADFGEIDPAAELEGADLAEPPRLEFTEEMAEHEAATAESSQGGQNTFIGLDDLDRVRRLRIGDVATAAAMRVAEIKAKAAEKTGEYAALQAYVVTNLDQHTGAFTPQDEASRATFQRYMVLEEARQRVTMIDTHREEATAYLLDEARTREEIVAYDAEEGW